MVPPVMQPGRRSTDRPSLGTPSRPGPRLRANRPHIIGALARARRSASDRTVPLGQALTQGPQDRRHMGKRDGSELRPSTCPGVGATGRHRLLDTLGRIVDDDAVVGGHPIASRQPRWSAPGQASTTLTSASCIQPKCRRAELARRARSAPPRTDTCRVSVQVISPCGARSLRISRLVQNRGRYDRLPPARPTQPDSARNALTGG
jgi:hypothetical protein